MLHLHLIDLRQVGLQHPPAPRSDATCRFSAPPMAWSTLESTRNLQLGAWCSANATAACATSPRCATRARGSADPVCTPSVLRHLAELPLRPSLVNTSHCINDYFVLFWSQKGTKKIQATWLKKAPPKAWGSRVHVCPVTSCLMSANSSAPFVTRARRDQPLTHTYRAQATASAGAHPSTTAS